jgi:hypothetical protein
MNTNMVLGFMTWLNSLIHLGDSIQGMLWRLPIDWIVLAQQFDQDILGDLQKGFDNFVKTGQVWALIIGIVLGYLLRSVTAY